MGILYAIQALVYKCCLLFHTLIGIGSYLPNLNHEYEGTVTEGFSHEFGVLITILNIGCISVSTIIFCNDINEMIYHWILCSTIILGDDFKHLHKMVWGV